MSRRASIALLAMLLLAMAAPAAVTAATSEAKVTEAVYRHQVMDDLTVVSEFSLTVKNNLSTPLEEVTFLTAIVPAQLLEMTASGPGGPAAVSEVMSEGAQVRLSLSLAEPIAPGGTGNIAGRYVTSGDVSKVGDAFTVKVPNFVTTWLGEGRKTFKYEVLLPSGMTLRQTVPNGGQAQKAPDGLTKVTYATDYPSSLFTVTYAEKAARVADNTLVYLLYFGLAGVVAFLLLRSGVWKAYVGKKD